ncbi:MAG: hypothetical protein JXR73_21855, partial [Candidatus Omnitrophica bacterium]|nr:hypothetical protein [Candidatus Omnitrophota bacterium]
MKIRRVFNISIPMFSSMMILLGMSLSSSALDFPGPKPGAAHSQVVDQHELRLFNDLISFSWSTSGDILKPVSVINLLSGEKIDLKNREIFVIELGGGEIKSSEMRISDSRKPLQQTLTGDSNASTLSKRHPGRQFELVLTASDPRCTIIWRAELRDGANAIRQSIEILPFSDPCLIKQIQLIALPSQGVAPGGAVPGSPLMLNHFFWAYEHPNAEIHSNANEAQCFLRLHQVLQPGEALAQSWAVGVAPEDQMRRAFLYYIERERAHPYRPFLHYNSWYDICWGNQKINEEQCLKVIDGFGQELIRKRNVKLASFVWDDGWDDPATLWRPVTKNFPNGFSTMLQTARSYGSTLGFWLSPFGGYGQPAKDRLTFGKEQGFEFKNDKFSLAGAKYYERFLETCSTFIQRDGANFFKFDGLTRDVSETQAMLRLTQALRKLDQDLFISITTGTWPSPFWLWYGDSTWRGDGDMGFHGPGPKREQWITYR